MYFIIYLLFTQYCLKVVFSTSAERESTVFLHGIASVVIT